MGLLTRDGKRWKDGVKWGLALLTVGLVALQWATDEVTGGLLTEVPKVRLFPWLETRYTYLLLHLFTVIPVLSLSFDRRVAYYRSWRLLFPAILPVAVIFILWDVFFTVSGVWGFNDRYLTGWRILHLPVEEWLFFLTVPFACVFIYECLNYYIKKDLLKAVEPFLTPLLIVLFLAIGGACFSQRYTATTFLLTGGFLLYHYLFLDGRYRSRFYLAYAVSWLPFLLVNGVLTGGYTQEPVVLYNPGEYLGIRVTSIPLDDSIYSFLLLLGVITLYEERRTSKVI